MKLDPTVVRTIARLSLALVTVFVCAACTSGSAPDSSPTRGAAREETFGGEGPLLHAMGFEPGWTLDIYADSMVYVGRYGEERVVAPRPRQLLASDDPGTTYHVRAGGYEFRIRVLEDPCQRPGGRAGPPELTVVLELDGHHYRGCGTRV